MRMSSLFTGRRKGTQRALRNAIANNTNAQPVLMGTTKTRGCSDSLSKRCLQRNAVFEHMESRTLFNVDPIWVGGVYLEADNGSDHHGDTFYISFTGGADGTTLNKLVIDGDQGAPGFNVGDNFFDTVASGLGADNAFPFQIVELRAADPNAKVTASVQDGSTQLVLTFENFRAGDVLVFSIDVDEVEFYDPTMTDLNDINSGFDPITSGVEFQSSAFKAYFTAPHYEDIDGNSQFWNRYDSYMAGSQLELPADDDNGLRDRTAGTAFSVTQIAKPISIAGTVYVDNNLNLVKDSGEQGLSGVTLELFKKQGSQFVSTGFTTTTKADGSYEFGLNLKLMPGTYEVRESQPDGYYSVGATAGKLNDGSTVGQTVLTNKDILTEITILLGDTHATQLNFAEAQPTTVRGYVYQDLDNDGLRDSSEVGIGGVEIRLESLSTINGNITRTTTTAADGSYSFTNLPPGRYRIVEVAQPAGFYDGKDTVGRVGSQTRGVVTVNDVIDLIDLNGNENGVEFNFGELPPGRLSGLVKIVNPGYTCDDMEPGAYTPLPGVTVQLIDINGAVVTETVTDSTGHYLFENLPVGVYTIREITPEGVIDGGATVGTIGGSNVGTVVGTSRIEAINLQPGQNGIDYNFCELLPAELSGHVFEDINDDGIRQDGETLLAGVRIDLYDSQGNLVDSVSTDQNGFYSFRFLGPGTYRLRETTPANFLDGKDIAGSINGQTVGVVDSAADTISQIVLPHGRQGIDYDFGEIRPGSLSGQVIVDINDNNAIDHENERPLSGVTIQLLDAQGNVVQTTTTNSNGEYLFSDIRPGRYSVRELQPAGYFQGKTYAGSQGGDVTELDYIRGFQINSGATLTDYDFTEIPPAQIAGYVFIDNNGDCLVQPAERRLADVRVDLIDVNGTVLQTTRTGSDGSYQFTNLAPGRYAIRETQPEGYLQGKQRAGSGGGDASVQDIITAIDIEGGDDLIDYNFCEQTPASIAGKVFEDLDLDCIHDVNESPIAGVRVELLDGSGTVIAFTVTDSQGRYTFTNLTPGRYSVREIQPNGYFQGGQMAPSGRADTSIDDLLANIDLLDGEFLDNLDFCEIPPATISGYVFQDGATIKNTTGEVPDALRPLRDGVRDASDKPLANVVLELRAVNGTQFPSDRALPGIYSGPVIRVTTDANGYFEFKGLRPGAYHVYQVQPDGYYDGLDTPGTTGGLSINKEDLDSNPQAANLLLLLSASEATNPRNDAILMIQIAAGQSSRENNFSEVLVERDNPVPPIDIPRNPVVVPPTIPELYPGPQVVLPPIVPPAVLPDLIISGAAPGEFTWHLSVINSGTPRGSDGVKISKARLADIANILDVYHWKVAALRNSSWTFVSTDNVRTQLVSKNSFDIPDAIPLAGDFNGDGVDELALYLEGEWLIDVNGNGRWDDADMWAKLGDKADLPVIGDWDGDGKDDIGVFGPKWEGDEIALEYETGLPDSENRRRVKPKNVPPEEELPETHRRILQRSTQGAGRSDVIDHVFQQGTHGDRPLAGDFNGDGISTIGIFRDGKWRLDTNGDGKFNAADDGMFEFGKPGDVAVVGDFDGDGIDDIAVIRNGKLIVDSNHNGVEDVTDRVFELEAETGEYVVGDFDGDGIDQAALHRSLNDTDNSRIASEGTRDASVQR